MLLRRINTNMYLLVYFMNQALLTLECETMGELKSKWAGVVSCEVAKAAALESKLALAQHDVQLTPVISKLRQLQETLRAASHFEEAVDL